MTPTMGRPSAFNQEIADRILTALIEGNSLRTICTWEEMPNVSTVIRWLCKEEHADFRAHYERARQAQADTLADEILHIADNPQLGITTTIKPQGRETREGDMVEHRKLQIDARKWFSSKLAPKKYGDSTHLKHSDPDGGPVALTTKVSLIFGKPPAK
jgi:hypothetical protein